jgi:hypothetical protein
VWEEWRYSSTVLNLVSGWRWVVSLMPRPLYPQVLQRLNQGECDERVMQQAWQMWEKYTNIYTENLNGIDVYKIFVGGRIILKQIFIKRVDKYGNWNHLAHERRQLKALINMVIKFSVTQRMQNLLSRSVPPQIHGPNLELLTINWIVCLIF